MFFKDYNKYCMRQTPLLPRNIPDNYCKFLPCNTLSEYITVLGFTLNNFQQDPLLHFMGKLLADITEPKN